MGVHKLPAIVKAWPRLSVDSGLDPQLSAAAPQYVYLGVVRGLPLDTLRGAHHRTNRRRLLKMTSGISSWSPLGDAGEHQRESETIFDNGAEATA